MIRLSAVREHFPHSHCKGPNVTLLPEEFVFKRIDSQPADRQLKDPNLQVDMRQDTEQSLVRNQAHQS